MSIKQPKIFLDSGDPEETKKAKSLLGFLDGQTTNPSLVAKNPDVQKIIKEGNKLDEYELMKMYKEMVEKIEQNVAGPISVEVYADWETSVDAMLEQAKDIKGWGRNIYVKFPTIPNGLEAANAYIKTGGNVNMTLVFDQNQAAAVYAATLPTFRPDFISPFVGRWDDRGFKGLDLIKNIKKMYDEFDKKRNEKRKHVEILAASIRSLDHFYASIFLGADILTVPLKIIEEWVEDGRKIPDENYRIDSNGLRSIIYKNIDYHDDYKSYKIEKEQGSLLDEGLEKFIKDWRNLIK